MSNIPKHLLESKLISDEQWKEYQKLKLELEMWKSLDNIPKGGNMKLSVGDVVQFNENHKWRGCLGFIDEVKVCRVPNINNEPDDIIKTDTRYMVGVPMPMQGTAYIYVMESENAIEYIGTALLVPRKEEE